MVSINNRAKARAPQRPEPWRFEVVSEYRISEPVFEPTNESFWEALDLYGLATQEAIDSSSEDDAWLRERSCEKCGSETDEPAFRTDYRRPASFEIEGDSTRQRIQVLCEDCKATGFAREHVREDSGLKIDGSPSITGGLEMGRLKRYVAG